MIPLKLYLIVGGALVLFLGLWGYKVHYDNQLKLEGQLEFLQKDLKQRDSTMAVFIASLVTRMNLQFSHTNTTIEHWKTTVEKIPTLIAGKIDSVYKDSAFAKLPDSLKVRVLRDLGSSLAGQCSEVISSCQTFRDSALKAFRTKDSLTDVAKQLYLNKPRRKCGLGATLGGIAGLGPVRSDTGSKSSWKPIYGLGASAGLSCSF